MNAGYVLRRIGIFFIVLWAAASFNFVLPRLSGINPIEERLLQMASMGGASAGNMEQMILSYERRFGLDQPMWKQYVLNLKNTAKFDFGFSIVFFPTPVMEIIRQALPWTLVLITIVTLMSFALGVFFGAIIVWPGAHGGFRVFVPVLMGLSAIPYYLVGIILIYLFAFVWKVFPLGGGYSIGEFPEWSFSFVWDAVQHSILPAVSILASTLGIQALSMRGMMITTLGEDYMTLGEAKGLKGTRLFLWYAVRNAMLPQMTVLALSLGYVVSGAILVEVVFAYPGMGGTLYDAIRFFDYTLLFGIVYLIILAIAFATLMIDLLYPKLDPRITYAQR